MTKKLTDGQREYREVYLHSDHWRQMRALALEDAEDACAVCCGKKNLDVHHRTYERMGAERLTDLLVLCRQCHTIFHEHGRLANSKAREPKAKTLRGPGSATEKQLAYIRELGGNPPDGLGMKAARKMTTRLQKQRNARIRKASMNGLVRGSPDDFVVGAPVVPKAKTLSPATRTSKRKTDPTNSHLLPHLRGRIHT